MCLYPWVIYMKPINTSFFLLELINFSFFKKFKGCGMFFDPRSVRNKYPPPVSTDEDVIMKRVYLTVLIAMGNPENGKLGREEVRKNIPNQHPNKPKEVNVGNRWEVNKVPTTRLESIRVFQSLANFFCCWEAKNLVKAWIFFCFDSLQIYGSFELRGP